MQKSVLAFLKIVDDTAAGIVSTITISTTSVPSRSSSGGTSSFAEAPVADSPKRVSSFSHGPRPKSVPSKVKPLVPELSPSASQAWQNLRRDRPVSPVRSTHDRPILERPGSFDVRSTKRSSASSSPSPTERPSKPPGIRPRPTSTESRSRSPATGKVAKGLPESPSGTLNAKIGKVFKRSISPYPSRSSSEDSPDQCSSSGSVSTPTIGNKEAAIATIKVLKNRFNWFRKDWDKLNLRVQDACMEEVGSISIL